MKAKQNSGEVHEVAICDGKNFSMLGTVAVTQAQYEAIEAAHGVGPRRIFVADVLGDANLEKLGLDSGGDWRNPVCFGETWN